MIAVIGAGPRGRAFARRCLVAGYDVVLEDVLSSNLRKAEQVLADERERAQGSLQMAGSVEEAVREADLVVDFVPDELESKLEILSMLDRMAPPRTLFCTPTALSISDLAACTYRAGQCVALTPMGHEEPTQATVVQGKATEATTVERVSDWLSSLGIAVTVEQESTESAL